MNSMTSMICQSYGSINNQTALPSSATTMEPVSQADHFSQIFNTSVCQSSARAAQTDQKIATVVSTKLQEENQTSKSLSTISISSSSCAPRSNNLQQQEKMANWLVSAFQRQQNPSILAFDDLPTLQGKAWHYDKDSEFEFGIWLERALQWEKNDAAILTKVQKLAEQNEPSAQALLGLWYETGHGVYQNTSEALRLYCIAARLGEEFAQNKIKQIASKEAIELIISHAKADGCYELASNFFNGLGVPQDFSFAFRLFLAAAEKGAVGAQRLMGLWYELGGQDVKRDLGQAVRYYRLAAIRKDIYSIEQMNHYDQIETWKKAAEKADPEALLLLGKSYVDGSYIEYDFEKGKQLVELAAAKGNTNASLFLSTLNKTEPKSFDEAFQKRQQDGSYFLFQCYKWGILLPKNINMLNELKKD